MSFKKFSSTQDSAAKGGSAEKSKEAAPAEKPGTTPAQKSEDVTLSPKS